MADYRPIPEVRERLTETLRQDGWGKKEAAREIDDSLRRTERRINDREAGRVRPREERK